ncbi:hypothetical protein FGO68_gene12111 [Halteria grandinella]|uniref:Uncharacterized protein n=1 Tax=Halteria grandinella TaxID=5974 RepID=A0A8J8T4M3_HALGN|nr:hypothetical protein FGO68_gene12111 [Halteria grandinella]
MKLKYLRPNALSQEKRELEALLMPASRLSLHKRLKLINRKRIKAFMIICSCLWKAKSSYCSGTLTKVQLTLRKCSLNRSLMRKLVPHV